MEPEDEIFYLWFMEDLTDPDSDTSPLAVLLPEGGFEWAPDEPRHRGALLDMIFRALPQMVEHGRSGMIRHWRDTKGQGNIFIGPSFPRRTALPEWLSRRA